MFLEELYNAVQCIPLRAEFKDTYFGILSFSETVWLLHSLSVSEKCGLVRSEVMQDRSILDNTERRIFLFHPQYKYALSVVTIEQY